MSTLLIQIIGDKKYTVSVDADWF